MLQAVSVTFEELNLEPSYRCRRDKLRLYEGSVYRNFCSVTVSSTMTYTSSGSHLFVLFTSDRSVNEGRFALSWRFVSPAGDIGWFATNTTMSLSLRFSPFFATLFYLRHVNRLNVVFGCVFICLALCLYAADRSIGNLEH